MGFDEVKRKTEGAVRNAKEQFPNRQQNQSQGRQNDQNRQDQDANFSEAQRNAQGSDQQNGSFKQRAGEQIDRGEDQIRSAADNAKDRFRGNSQQ